MDTDLGGSVPVAFLYESPIWTHEKDSKDYAVMGRGDKVPLVCFDASGYDFVDRAAQGFDTVTKPAVDLGTVPANPFSTVIFFGDNPRLSGV